MANDKAKKKSADKSEKDLKGGKGGKPTAEMVADKATKTYKSLEKKVPKKKRGYLKAALNHATDKELEAVKRAKTKKPGFAGVLAITPLGWLGLDRFYIGDILRAITKILATVIIALAICARFLPYFKGEVATETATAPGTPSESVQLTDGENVPEAERFTLPAAYVGIWDNKMPDGTKLTIYLYANGAEIVEGDSIDKTPVVLAKAGEGSNTYYYLEKETNFNIGDFNQMKIEVKSGKLVVSELTDEPVTPDPDPDPNPDPNPNPTPDPDPNPNPTPDPDPNPNPNPNPDEGDDQTGGGDDQTETESVKFAVALDGEEGGDTNGESGDGGTTEPPATDAGEGGNEGGTETGGEETQEPAEEPEPDKFAKRMDKGETQILRAGIPEGIATIVVIALCAFFGLYLLFDIFLTPKKARKDNYYKVMKILAPETDE